MPVLTGIVVALGAMVLLSAGIGALLVVVDALPVEGDETAELGIGGSLALVVGLFISYLWGGYTAGRMARGQGVRTGLLVAAGAALVALAAAGAASAADLDSNLGVPWTSERLPIEEEVIIDWGVLLGAVSLVAMAAGGAYGGLRGVRWHHRLEDEARPQEPPTADREPENLPPAVDRSEESESPAADPAERSASLDERASDTPPYYR